MNISKQTIHATMHAGSRSFWLASRFLPDSYRTDAAYIYAFCRYLDDIADETRTPKMQIVQQLKHIQSQLKADLSPILEVKAYLEIVHKYGISIKPAMHLIDGMLADQDVVRIANDQELIRYCYQVAGTVGIMMCKVLGISDEALPQAVDLGIAMQLTNICRDVAEDAKMGRIYLPKERLDLAGVCQDDLLVGCESPKAVALVIGELVNLAEHYYRSAEQGFTYIPIRLRVAIVIAARIYRAIGLQLANKGCNYQMGRSIVSPWEKIYWVGYSLLETVTPKSLGFYPPELHDSWLHRFIGDFPGTYSDKEWKNLTE